jgi:hypothetical protein
MLELSERIREFIDSGATTITAEEVMITGQPVEALSRSANWRWPRRVDAKLVVALAAAVVLVVTLTVAGPLRPRANTQPGVVNHKVTLPDRTAFLNPPKAETASVPDLTFLKMYARNLATQDGDSALHHGYVALTSREQAAAPDVVNSNQPVYQIVLHGRFTCGACSVAPGAHPPVGTWITAAIDRHTLQGIDFGITKTPPSVSAGEAVYGFSF